MTPLQIAPDLYKIAVPTPFPVGPVNLYLATGRDGSLSLIDTGPRTDQARAVLQRSLADLNYTFADIQRIIITHGHTDHYGLAGDITKISGAKVYAHPRSRSLLEDHSTERDRRGKFYRSVLVEAGAPKDIQATVLQVLKGFRQFATAVSPVHTLDEGDTLLLAGQSWRVLFLPGHAGGLICLYQPETQLFLSNDHLLRDISSNPFFEPPLPGQSHRSRSLVDYIASLRRTAALDIAVSWPGHGEPIYDHQTLIKDRLTFHRHRADRIIAALHDTSQTVYELSEVIFPDLSAVDRFLAISEVLAHLEWLEDRGIANSQPQDDLVLWGKK